MRKSVGGFARKRCSTFDSRASRFQVEPPENGMLQRADGYRSSCALPSQRGPRAEWAAATDPVPPALCFPKENIDGRGTIAWLKRFSRPSEEIDLRHIVKPFVKEVKGRWAKPTKRRVGTEAEPSHDGSVQHATLPAAAADADGRADTHEAAVRAANALFEKQRAAPVPEPSAREPAVENTAPRRAGRILPSLINNVPEDDGRPSPRAKASPKPKPTPKPARRKSQVLPIEEPTRQQAGTKASTKRISAAQDSNAPAAPTSRRASRRLQRRWVLRSEPMAGQKWKKRLRYPKRFY